MRWRTWPGRACSAHHDGELSDRRARRLARALARQSGEDPSQALRDLEARLAQWTVADPSPLAAGKVLSQLVPQLPAGSGGFGMMLRRAAALAAVLLALWAGGQLELERRRPEWTLAAVQARAFDGRSPDPVSGAWVARLLEEER